MVGFLSGAGAAAFGPQLAGVALGSSQAAINAYSSYKNFSLQKRQFNYQRDLQNIMMQREDTAIQRRQKDLIAAGLSPVLAAGQGASAGPVVSTQAPQLQAPDFGITDAAQVAMSLLRMDADISQTKASTELTKLLQDKAKAETNGVIIENARKSRDNYLNQQTGLPSNPSGVGKIFRDLGSVFQSAIDNQVKNFKNKSISIFGHEIYKSKSEGKK